MKHKTTKSLGFAALLVAGAISARADITLFEDKFEGTNLVQWVGKSGSPPNGQIVVDPLNPTNHVLTFSAVNYSGDTFTAAPLNVGRPRRYVLSFDFLGNPSAGENGGFLGIASAPTGESQQV